MFSIPFILFGKCGFCDHNMLTNISNIWQKYHLSIMGLFKYFQIGDTIQ